MHFTAEDYDVMGHSEDQYSYGMFHITNTLCHDNGDHSQCSTQLDRKTPQMIDNNNHSDKGIHGSYDYSLERSQSDTIGYQQGE